MDRAVRFSLFALGTFLGSLIVLFATRSTDTDKDDIVSIKGVEDEEAIQEPDWGELEIRERERGERRAAAITAAAARETVDPDWGPLAERQIADRFAAHGPAGATLLSVTCKTSLCIVEIEMASRKQSTGQLAWRSFFGLSRGFVHHGESAPDSASRSVVFLAREGHRLPHETDLN